jgi:Dolichyl-phosphate-mannose-protein mannosyltransferase
MLRLRKRAVRIALLLLAAIMAWLMWRPIREESATIDEPMFLAAGYTYWQGNGFRFDPEQPPLSKLISALPLSFMNVRQSDWARAMVAGHVSDPQLRKWSGDYWPGTDPALADGPGNWYVWKSVEAYLFGYALVYRSGNNAESLMAAGRAMQVILAMGTGLAIAAWAWSLGGAQAALLAMCLWVFNPVALACGHLITTDIGTALMFVLAVWAFCAFLQEPTVRTSLLTGLAVGGAFGMKFSAMVLLPVFAALAMTFLWKLSAERTKATRAILRRMPWGIAAAWVTIFLVYTPYWSPATPLPSHEADLLAVPQWFRTLRLLLIPPDFFKGIALQLGHVARGHEGYLCGEWRLTGWWYYYPVALALKTPLPLLILMLAGGFWLLPQIRWLPFRIIAPAVAATVYLGVAMSSTINVGIRHLLPMYALGTVGVVALLDNMARPVRIIAWVLCGWLIVNTIQARPFFIEYFNELAGGPRQGYKYLVDSNLDWAQDAKRLSEYLRVHEIKHIYLRFFGSNDVLDYYKVPYTTVTADEARQIQRGILVVSATYLVRPEWNWLRSTPHPTDRIGYGLFVFQLGD